LHAPASAPEASAATGGASKGSYLAVSVLTLVLAALAAGAAYGISHPTLPVVAIMLSAAAVVGGRLFTWRNLFFLLLLVMLVVPIRKYTLSSGAGFQLEPYRLVVFALGAIWLASLLIDPRVRLRRSGLEAPLLAVVVAILASDAVNTGRINELGVQSIVTKKLIFFLSFILVVYMISSVVTSRIEIDYMLKTLVVGGAVLSFFALIEFNTGYDVFDHLSRLFPLLRIENTGFHSLEVRGGRARVYGSGQHPIAYGAFLLMLMPFGIYFARRSGRRIWWAIAGLLVLGTLTTISRTSILMMLVVLFIYWRLFPRSTRRLLPLLVPAILVIHLALPGSLGTIWGSFFPHGGLVKQQEAGKGTGGSGRVADLGPGLSEAAQTPFLGQGYGTRVVDQGPLLNAPILDDQWLGTLLETGIIGVLTWVWLFVVFTRRMLRRAREDLDSPDAWLYAAFGSAIASFAVGMLFYDAFAFIQVTFLAFLLMTLGMCVVRADAAVRPAALVRPATRFARQVS
jgi:hypothetical protein